MSINVGAAYKNSLYDQVKRDTQKFEGKGVAQKDFSNDVRDAGKNADAGQKIEKYDAKAKESKLSEKAQEFLKGLREKYGDYDFMIGNKSDDLQSIAQSGSKEFSVIFSSAEIERMANDEKYAEEKMQGVEGAVKMSKRILEENGFLSAFGEGEGENGTINKISIAVGDDGNMKIFAELEKTTDKQKERIEKAREKRAEERKAHDKAEKKNPYGKEEKSSVKRTTVEANSVDEMIEKIQKIDWEKIAESRSGDRFNFTV